MREGWRVSDPQLNKVAVWTYYSGAKRDPGIDEGDTTVAYVPEKGWFWYIPQHNDMVSVGVVAEGKYLSRDGVKSRSKFSSARSSRTLDQGSPLRGRAGRPLFRHERILLSLASLRMRGTAARGRCVWLSGSGLHQRLMLALKSGVLAGDAVHEAIVERNFAPALFEPYARDLRHGIENMRKLVYAFYDQEFSFKRVIDKYPDAGGESPIASPAMWTRISAACGKKVSEFVTLPEDLPVVTPLRT